MNRETFWALFFFCVFAFWGFVAAVLAWAVIR